MFMSNPGEAHKNGLKYALMYIFRNRSLGLVYSENTSRNELHGFVDSDFEIIQIIGSPRLPISLIGSGIAYLGSLNNS
ncbi:hypothetical protein LINPERPRIM_LOCUS35469 [Linum perenne]